jgi:hypothetical protein
MSIINKLFKNIRNMNLPFGNDNVNTKELEMYNIKQILEKDYEKIGFQDAIYEPSQAIIDLKLDRLKFLLLNEYQLQIDKKNERITKLKKLYETTRNIDPMLSEKLNTDIEIVEYDLEKLLSDYDLIDKREGKFKIIENSYKIGYTTGVISYKNSIILN